MKIKYLPKWIYLEIRIIKNRIKLWINFHKYYHTLKLLRKNTTTFSVDDLRYKQEIN